MLTSVSVFLAKSSFTLLRRKIFRGVWRRLGRILRPCCRGWSLGGCLLRLWPDEGLGVFWRRRLGILGVLGENRLGFDDHGEINVASGLH